MVLAELKIEAEVIPFAHQVALGVVEITKPTARVADAAADGQEAALLALKVDDDIADASDNARDGISESARMFARLDREAEADD